MTVQRKKREGAAVDPADIVAYLNEHPDFFEKHSELAETLAIPHSSGGAVSLIERQVSVLRDQNKKLRRQMQELVEIARDNDRLFGHLQSLTLALLEAEDLDATFAAVYDQLRHGFGAHAVALRFFNLPASALSERAEFISDDQPIKAAFDKILGGSKPVCGRFEPAQLRMLFGEGAEEYKSAALIPLGRRDERIGLLAVASQDPSHFRAGMSTLFLGYLGETVTAAVERFGR